jgi:hypothetical protein
MNEIRHVMLPRLDDPPKAIKHQPWYVLFSDYKLLH